MLVTLFELSNDASGVIERGGIIWQQFSYPVAVLAVGPSDSKKIPCQRSEPFLVRRA